MVAAHDGLMDDVFSPADLETLTALVSEARLVGADRDWSARAGTLAEVADLARVVGNRRSVGRPPARLGPSPHRQLTGLRRRSTADPPPPHPFALPSRVGGAAEEVSWLP